MDYPACRACGVPVIGFRFCPSCILLGPQTAERARLETQHEPRPAAPPADTGADGLRRLAEHLSKNGGRMPIRGGAPAAVVGAEREALRGYNLALAHSLEAAHRTLQEVAKKRDLSVADVLRLAHEALAENRERLRVEAGVRVRSNGEG